MFHRDGGQDRAGHDCRHSNVTAPSLLGVRGVCHGGMAPAGRYDITTSSLGSTKDTASCGFAVDGEAENVPAV